jgi:hypothetical protein
MFLPVLLSVGGLAAVLGCAGKTRYDVPRIDLLTPVQAKVGASVVITGANFKSIDFVSFGGANAGYHVDSDSQITATVPATAISYSVSVVNPAGVGHSLTPFLVVPQITAISPESGPAATVITLTGSGFYDTTGVVIGGETPGASTFTYNDPNRVTVVAGSTSGPVVLTASGIQVTGPVFTVQ